MLRALSVVVIASLLLGCGVRKQPDTSKEESTKFYGCDIARLVKGKQTGDAKQKVVTVIDFGDKFAVEKPGERQVESTTLTTKQGNAIVSDPKQAVVYGKGVGPFMRVYSIYSQKDEVTYTFDCRKASRLTSL
ncbi:TPA: hypothetical protein MH639_24770 [Klebsiella pneumoniae]|nr:hypothetical protein [Klebsiella pneumoniae]